MANPFAGANPYLANSDPEIAGMTPMGYGQQGYGYGGYGGYGGYNPLVQSQANAYNTATNALFNQPGDTSMSQLLGGMQLGGLMNFGPQVSNALGQVGAGLQGNANRNTQAQMFNANYGLQKDQMQMQNALAQQQMANQLAIGKGQLANQGQVANGLEYMLSGQRTPYMPQISGFNAQGQPMFHPAATYDANGTMTSFQQDQVMSPEMQKMIGWGQAPGSGGINSIFSTLSGALGTNPATTTVTMPQVNNGRPTSTTASNNVPGIWGPIQQGAAQNQFAQAANSGTLNGSVSPLLGNLLNKGYTETDRQGSANQADFGLAQQAAQNQYGLGQTQLQNQFADLQNQQIANQQKKQDAWAALMGRVTGMGLGMAGPALQGSIV